MLLDTNILIGYVRKHSYPPQESFISTITVGEIKSMAIRNNWGKTRQIVLEQIFDSFPVLNIDYEMTDLYASIDAFSQGKLPERPLPIGLSARNMGKNDLWIATIAMFFDLELHTIDNDFDHLEEFGLLLVKL